MFGLFDQGNTVDIFWGINSFSIDIPHLFPKQAELIDKQINFRPPLLFGFRFLGDNVDGRGFFSTHHFNESAVFL